MKDNALVVVITNMERKNRNEINLSWIYSVSCVVNFGFLQKWEIHV